MVLVDMVLLGQATTMCEACMQYCSNEYGRPQFLCCGRGVLDCDIEQFFNTRRHVSTKVMTIVN